MPMLYQEDTSYVVHDPLNPFSILVHPSGLKKALCDHAKNSTLVPLLHQPASCHDMATDQ